MTAIQFAQPHLLWLLLLVPAMIAFYVIRQSKTTASLSMPGLKPFENAGMTYRNYLRHIFFDLFRVTVCLLIFGIARPCIADMFQ